VFVLLLDHGLRAVLQRDHDAALEALVPDVCEGLLDVDDAFLLGVEGHVSTFCFLQAGKEALGVF
jgi:hypothetical protein